ncbi:cytochrome c oxidase assembly protein [Microbacterium sp. YY-03]|uniref:cytochrome c oxidase assembly protein n=1 Tax=Microbacterium sp. YY-03 TaxID=3421636 RepID=UPI003D183135
MRMPDMSGWVHFAPLSGSLIVAIGAIALCTWYLWGALKLWRQQRRWNVARTISFVLGCAVMFAIATFGVNTEMTTSLAALMFVQITALVVVPPLLVVGSPGHLLLRTTPHHGLGRVVLRVAHAGLRSPMMRFLTHPAMPIAFALIVYPGLYFTDAISPIIGSRVGADLLLIGLLVIGIVSAVPLWSADPLPRPPSYPIRLIDILVELQIHAIMGLILLRAASPMFSRYTGPDALAEQSIAGTLLWTYAELPLLIVLIVALSRWHDRDRSHARINESREDAELDEYNAYLASIARKN